MQFRFTLFKGYSLYWRYEEVLSLKEKYQPHKLGLFRDGCFGRRGLETSLEGDVQNRQQTKNKNLSFLNNRIIQNQRQKEEQSETEKDLEKFCKFRKKKYQIWKKNSIEKSQIHCWIQKNKKQKKQDTKKKEAKKRKKIKNRKQEKETSRKRNKHTMRQNLQGCNKWDHSRRNWSAKRKRCANLFVSKTCQKEIKTNYNLTCEALNRKKKKKNEKIKEIFFFVKFNFSSFHTVNCSKLKVHFYVPQIKKSQSNKTNTAGPSGKYK
jgi:hypothetical protein